MHYFDVAVLIMVSVLIYQGVTKGLLKSFFVLLQFAGASIITFFYHKSFLELLLAMTPFKEYVNDFIGKRLLSLGGQVSETTVNIADLEALTKIPLPAVIKEKIIEQLTSTINTQSMSVVSALTDMTLSLIASALLFVSVYLLLMLVFSAINALSKLPLINEVNKLAGGLLGLINGYFIASLIVLILLAANTMFINGLIDSALKDSLIFKWLVDYNVFVFMRI